MSQKISQELLKIIETLGKMEFIISKIDSSIFVKNCNKIINEKTIYLTNLLETISEKYKDNITQIVSKYNEKLEIIYSEFYCQYTTIQNELQDATLNKRIAMVNYQKIINDSEKNILEHSNKKNSLKLKNTMHKKIIDVCNQKIIICQKNFIQKMEEISKDFESYEISNESKIYNILKGNKKYLEILNDIENRIDKINTDSILEYIREDTIDFITKILQIKQIEE